MRLFLISLEAALLLMLALVGSGSAAGPGCSGFGAETAYLAQNFRPFGQLISPAATSGQASAIVASEHGNPELCASH